MNRHPHEPLTPEERELAQLTGRLGPHGEPSPALDARILAAAHAAVASQQARKPRSRWPVAMGVAASVVLAVGVAWQLRPLQQVAAVSEAPVQASEALDGSADAAAVAAPAPQAASDEASTASATVASSIAERPADATAVAPLSTPRRVEEPRAGAAASTTVADSARNHAASRDTDAYSAPRPPAAPPPPPPPPAAAAAMPAPKGLIAREPTPETPRAFTSEADSPVDTVNVTGSSSSNQAVQTRQEAAERTENKARAAAETAKEGAALDRIEVSGSRLQRTDLQVPVSDDARLPVKDWLERIRTRYGLGDADAARQSLQLFMREHPRQSIPDDLAPLLEP